MAIAYSSADFRHGPIATIDAGLPAILIMPSGAALDDMLELAQDLQTPRGRAADHQRRRRALGAGDARCCRWPAALPEWLSPLAAIVPGQLLALHLALAKGFDPDQPRGLHKVTRTVIDAWVTLLSCASFRHQCLGNPAGTGGSYAKPGMLPSDAAPQWHECPAHVPSHCWPRARAGSHQRPGARARRPSRRPRLPRQIVACTVSAASRMTRSAS